MESKKDQQVTTGFLKSHVTIATRKLRYFGFGHVMRHNRGNKTNSSDTRKKERTIIAQLNKITDCTEVYHRRLLSATDKATAEVKREELCGEPWELK